MKRVLDQLHFRYHRKLPTLNSHGPPLVPVRNPSSGNYTHETFTSELRRLFGTGSSLFCALLSYSRLYGFHSFQQPAPCGFVGRLRSFGPGVKHVSGGQEHLARPALLIKTEKTDVAIGATVEERFIMTTENAKSPRKICEFDSFVGLASKVGFALGSGQYRERDVTWVLLISQRLHFR